jgi:hypothetical protein
MTGRLLCCVALSGWLMASGPLEAHHALTGVYDLDHEDTLSGTLVRIVFVNPHGSVTVSVTNPAGKTTAWTFTTDSAATLAAHGIATDSNVLKAGDRITVKFFPARNGTPIGYLKSITAADGTTIELPANPFNSSHHTSAR